ncbi:ClpXP protease specificity-enhancing factor [Proteobacteria bacterium 005FR1]|nr:ClpXP protease specificity-enhancing factor [Proteobacteria bacterium 005FR1]
MSMSSSRPYLIRALYQWMVDNDCTPHLLVDAHEKGTSVPQSFVNKDGRIVLNIGPTAVRDLRIENDAIRFNARFGGVPTDIYVPCSAVLSIHTRENGQGMIFEPEANRPPPPDDGGDTDSKGGGKRPSLRVVK